jgi:hypothetical protein
MAVLTIFMTCAARRQAIDPGPVNAVPPIWRRFRPVGVAGGAEPDWPFWGRLGSLRAGAGSRQILFLVLPLLG